VIAFFEWMEKKLYKKADIITFHSDGGRKFLINQKGIPPEKIVTIANWVDVDLYQNLDAKISFRERWALQDKFILVFAGIMGPAQGLEFVIEVARKVADLPDIVFLLVGDGMKKSKVENLIQKYGLKNVILKSFIAKDEYPYLVKDSDVGLVCLSAENKTPFIPGKFLGYMASGKVVLAFLNKESDGFTLVEKSQCGYAVVSDDLERAASVVKKMFNEKNKLKEMGNSGLVCARNNLSLNVCLEKFEKLL
jgi:glycosyltransferase involved in cell wall biosynthesis